MDRNDANQMFGSANVEKLETFRIRAGEVDFGDELHLLGDPQGTAIVCWSIDGRVAVKGRLYSDNLRDPQTATVEIRFRRANGQVTNLTTRSITSQGGLASRVVEKVSPVGNFNEVRIRLKQFLPDTGLGSASSVVATRTFRRTESVRLHIKILTNPNVNIATMVDSMEQVYASAGIVVRVISTENLNLPALTDLDVGGCIGGITTAEQNQLFANRNSVGANDVVAYFVHSTIPPFNGCAAHPAGRPGAVVAQGATRWTLGHEIGHVLGLNHVNDNKRLMTGNGTANITNPPPNLIASEVQTMLTSNLTQ
jgi:hypothetical protein